LLRNLILPHFDESMYYKLGIKNKYTSSRKLINYGLNFPTGFLN
jgi:hypothetical protein